MMFLLALLTLAASSYTSFACFCIVHRMNEQTKWSIALPIIAIAGVAAYALLLSLGYVLGVVATLPPALILSTLAATAVMLANPRIQTV